MRWGIAEHFQMARVVVVVRYSTMALNSTMTLNRTTRRT
jgi:hypothetical protein